MRDIKEFLSRHPRFFIILINSILFCLIFAAFITYTFNYRMKLREQNITDIENINQSSANISSSFFRSTQQELAEIVRYITIHKSDHNETLSFISDAHGDRNACYELIDSTCRGFVAEKNASGFIPVDYTSNSYDRLAEIFRGPGNMQTLTIKYTPEFTDARTARRSFALYTQISLLDSSKKVQRYTLLSVLENRDFTSFVQLNGGYKGMSTVFMTNSGDYVFGSSEFKSGNFFQYLYEYNDLSIEEKGLITSDFTTGRKRHYYYNNSRGEKCIYVYTTVAGTKWYCVSCVPLSSFRKNSKDLFFIFSITALLSVLLIFNFAWLNIMNHRLRRSVANERKAGAAKTDFLSRMSHDIRTPLNVIIGMTILAKKEDNTKATQGYLEHINESGKYLLSLVNDILDINKVESGKMQLHIAPYPFKQFAASMDAVISPLCIDKEIHFEIKNRCKNKVYMFDSMRINQIFFNILSNSVKFTEPGGHISLECDDKDISDTTSLVSFKAFDDGCGMSKEFQEHMFEAFTQEDANRTAASQGTGLGLTIVKKLVDLMNGTITVDSAPGKGTTFFITIPAEKSFAEPEKKKEKVQAANLAGKHILLFEDNALNAEIAEALLKDKKIIVDHAENGKEGLEIIESSEPYTYDAILMDLRMPVMDGFEATKRIRTLSRNDLCTIPIIAMTANAYDIDVQNCLDAGMDAHVAKPINPDELFSILSQKIKEK